MDSIFSFDNDYHVSWYFTTKIYIKKIFVVYKVCKMHFINQTGISAGDSSITIFIIFCESFIQKKLKNGSPVSIKEVHTKFQEFNLFRTNCADWDVTSGYPRYPIFCQFIYNEFLGKIRLEKGKVIFCLKVI